MISIDYKHHPKESFGRLLAKYPHNSFLILDRVLADEVHFSEVYQDMVDILKYGLEYKEIREYPIHFFIHEVDVDNAHDIYGECHTLELRHFLSNLCMWYAFMKMERVDIMGEWDIIDWRDKGAEDIARYIDEYIIPFYEDDFHSLNAIAEEILYNVKAISDAFCLIFGYSASIWDIMQAEENDPVIHDIIYSDAIEPGMQMHEIEAILSEQNDILMQHFAMADSDLRPLLKSGKNISKNQFKEIFLRVGFKADISSRTIPLYLDCNLLRTGYWLPSQFFINAESGRRAQMDSKLQMSKPGALSKKMNHSATSVILRKDYEVCDSARPVYYLVEDEDFLRMLDKRNYYTERGEMKMIDGLKDKHLIGKKIGVRSPCTCTSKDGICQACYGGLFHINEDLFSQGSLAGTKISEPTGQLILSQKHTNYTTSDEIVFSDVLFDQCFDIVSSEVTLSDENIDLQNSLMIQLGTVMTEETDDGDEYYVEYFDMVDYNGEVRGRIQESNGYPLYLADEMVAAWKQSAGHPIPITRFNDLDDSVTLFKIEVKSKAVTQSLQLITAILDSKDHLGHARDLDGICQRLGRILIDSNIMYPFVHGEMILRSLMRQVGNELKLPDFSANGDHDDLEFLRLTWSLRKNPSPIIRLCTGWLKSSLTSTSLYQSHEPSHFDALFVPKLGDIIPEYEKPNMKFIA